MKRSTLVYLVLSGASAGLAIGGLCQLILDNSTDYLVAAADLAIVTALGALWHRFTSVQDVRALKMDSLMPVPTRCRQPRLPRCYAPARL